MWQAGDDLLLVEELGRLSTRLNAVGEALAGVEQLHAMTDVTGFGLLGHLLEICRGSQLRGRIRWDAVPLIDGVPELAQVPYRTGAATRNATTRNQSASSQSKDMRLTTTPAGAW